MPTRRKPAIYTQAVPAIPGACLSEGSEWSERRFLRREADTCGLQRTRYFAWDLPVSSAKRCEAPTLKKRSGTGVMAAKCLRLRVIAPANPFLSVRRRRSPP